MPRKRVLQTAVCLLLAALCVAFLTSGRNTAAAPWRRRPRPDDAVYRFATTSSFRPVRVDGAGAKTRAELCASFPRHLLGQVQPVLKVGFGESRARVDALLASVAACLEPGDVLVVSDVAARIGPHDVVDVLADLPPAYHRLDQNPHFQHYLWQSEMRRNGTLRPQGEPTPGVDGWLLDKFKFLPMVERAWAAKPAKAFYFFEADTYVFWDNLFHLLQTLDPDAPLYLGSPSSGRRDEKRDLTTFFANGGPGFVLSRGAMQQLLHRERAPSGLFVDPSLSERWLPLVAGECCGDSVLGWALSRAGVALQGLWPLFNPHPLRGIPYGSAHWCQPVVTLHKTEAEDMVNLWKWEFEHRTLHRPLLYADLWHFLRTGQTETLQDWDNGNYDSWNAPPAAEIASVEACRAYCRSHGDCLQWNFKASDDVNECMLMRSIRLGRAADHQAVDADATKPHAAVKTTSGWITDRIASWVDASECNQIQWVSPSVQRIF